MSLGWRGISWSRWGNLWGCRRGEDSRKGSKASLLGNDHKASPLQMLCFTFWSPLWYNFPLFGFRSRLLSFSLVLAESYYYYWDWESRDPVWSLHAKDCNHLNIELISKDARQGHVSESRKILLQKSHTVGVWEHFSQNVQFFMLLRGGREILTLNILFCEIIPHSRHNTWSRSPLPLKMQISNHQEISASKYLHWKEGDSRGE